MAHLTLTDAASRIQMAGKPKRKGWIRGDKKDADAKPAEKDGEKPVPAFIAKGAERRKKLYPGKKG